MSILMNPTQPFVDQFGAARAGLPGAQLPWLDALRSSRIKKFTSIGIPTIKTETWKYTRLPNKPNKGRSEPKQQLYSSNGVALYW